MSIHIERTILPSGIYLEKYTFDDGTMDDYILNLGYDVHGGPIAYRITKREYDALYSTADRIELIPKFVSKCNDCGYELQSKIEMCPRCGSTSLRKPDESQLDYFKKEEEE